ncbi:MAG: MBL fold metallo-hydrolase, partial [Candidatus Aenigmatarchaeota archaeon]
ECIQLNRGGFVIIENGKLILQIGIPPETIKDTIKLYGEAPQYYLIPQEMIDNTSFLNVAEVEFPIYYNYFVKKRKTFLICNKKQKEIIEILFKESLIGPSKVLEEDFPSNIDCKIEEEMLFFRRKNPENKQELFDVFDSVEFIDIDKNVFINDLKLTKIGNKIFFFRDNIPVKIKIGDKYISSVDYNLKVLERKPLEKKKLSNFCFPRFGFTTLGSSNGFDPDGTTSGFILWINGRGIFIDPPAMAFSELEKNNIPISSIVGIILTHCHADHDAGTLQSMLRGNKEKIYTTRTIWNSFKRKYTGLLGVDEKFFDNLCDFKPVRVKEDINIENAIFRFHYALHSIPTIGFTVEFEGKTLFYSSDTFVSDKTKRLLDEGIISKERYDFVMNHFKKYDYILHEAGAGIIHTDISKLNFKTRSDQYIYAFHCPKKSYLDYISSNPNPNLLYPEQGVENTVAIIPQKRLSKFDVITSVKLFLDLPVRNIKKLEEKRDKDKKVIDLSNF